MQWVVCSYADTLFVELQDRKQLKLDLGNVSSD